MIIIVIGTRPEAIKLVPVIKALKEKGEVVKICLTGQHIELVNNILDFFQIEPDFDLRIMKPGQSLPQVTSKCIEELSYVFSEVCPSLLLVQGDTSSAFAGALAGFYNKILVGHVEAGLRSHNKMKPFPEEINRQLISRIATYHFAPTKTAMENLFEEGIKENVVLTGNTVVDALSFASSQLDENESAFLNGSKNLFNLKKDLPLILVTVHRRESFGAPLEKIVKALKEISFEFQDHQIIFPVHPNPKVKSIIHATLGKLNNVNLMNPMEYAELVWSLKNCSIILTDSGGIQEEAPSFGKPVLVLREETERVEGLKSGNSKLVGYEPETIVHYVRKLLMEAAYYKKFTTSRNLYGQGDAGQIIANYLVGINEFNS